VRLLVVGAGAGLFSAVSPRFLEFGITKIRFWVLQYVTSKKMTEPANRSNSSLRKFSDMTKVRKPVIMTMSTFLP